MTYSPATQDQLLAIRVNAGIEELAQSERFAAAEPDEASQHLRSAQIAAKVHERLKRSSQTKWSGAAL